MIPRPARPCLLLLLLAASGCGLVVTNERRTYDELDQTEQQANKIILDELKAFDAKLRKHGEAPITVLLDKERINVSPRGLMTASNLGAGEIHITTWENLTPAQQQLVAGWFGAASPAAARPIYVAFFYRFLGLDQGAKQVMYQALTPEYVNVHKAVYTIERHAIRLIVAFCRETGRQSLLNTVEKACQPLRKQYDAVWGQAFSQQHLSDNFYDLADPEAPTGYMYYLCRFVALAKQESGGFVTDVKWLKTK